MKQGFPLFLLARCDIHISIFYKKPDSGNLKSRYFISVRKLQEVKGQ